MKSLTGLFIFLAGAVVGSSVTYYLLTRKDEYEIISEGEDDKVLSSGNSNEVQKEVYDKYASIIDINGYVTKNKKEVEENMSDNPYVIPPEEFDMEDYDTCSLTYYADGVLTDENNDIIENVDDTVGLESLNHFGEFEDDSVFVRNDKLKIDYEILLDVRKYEESLS